MAKWAAAIVKFSSRLRVDDDRFPELFLVDKLVLVCDKIIKF